MSESFLISTFQSVFPPKLSLGQSKRHHAVVYLYAKLKPDITSEQLMSKVKVDPTEVGALAWFERSKVKDIVEAREGENNQMLVESKQGEMFRWAWFSHHVHV